MDIRLVHKQNLISLLERSLSTNSTRFNAPLIFSSSTTYSTSATRSLQPRLQIFAIVLPLCLYHGESSPYPYSTDLYDCFEDPELARELMFKSFRLIDLTTQSLEQLEQAGLAAMMEVLFKAHCGKQIRTLIADAIKAGAFARVLEQPLSRYYLHNTLDYTTIFDKEDLTAAEFLTLITEAVPDKREQIMTFREQLQQEGLQQGMQLGAYEAKREAARNMLAEDISREIIKRATGLSGVELDLL